MDSTIKSKKGVIATILAIISSTPVNADYNFTGVIDVLEELPEIFTSVFIMIVSLTALMILITILWFIMDLLDSIFNTIKSKIKKGF